MQDHELRGLLGPAYDDTTAEQRDAITRAVIAINARYRHPDLADTRQDAVNGALQVILGDDTLEVLADEWHAARAVERTAMARLTGAILASDTGSRGSEADLVARTNTSRVTIRRALGKP